MRNAYDAAKKQTDSAFGSGRYKKPLDVEPLDIKIPSTHYTDRSSYKY